jgi:hypothetical protein
VKLSFVSSLTSSPCLLLTTKPLLKNAVLINRWSERLKTVNVQKRTNYLRRRSSGWCKKRRDRNSRRKRIRDGRRTRGRGGEKGVCLTEGVGKGETRKKEGYGVRG